MLSEERVAEIQRAVVDAKENGLATFGQAIADLLSERQEAIVLSHKIASQRDELARERMLTRFEPLGRGHHNAQMCPSCNPQGYSFATIRALNEHARQTSAYLATLHQRSLLDRLRWALRPDAFVEARIRAMGNLALEILAQNEAMHDDPKARLGDSLEAMGR